MNALKKLFYGFCYAFSGIAYCIKTCRNFRIHTVGAAVVLYLSTFYNFSAVEYTVLFITIGAVICLECINTAMEEVCNAITKDFSLAVKRAKDVSAAAVLCSAVVSVAVAINLFWDKYVFKEIYNYFSTFPKFVCLSLIIVLAVIYIFYEDIFKHGKK